MRRITVWITATLAVVALVVAYQWNLAGGGKDGEDRTGQEAAVTCQTTTDSGSAAPCPPSSEDGAKADDTGADTDHTGRPGENK